MRKRQVDFSASLCLLIVILCIGTCLAAGPLDSPTRGVQGANDSTSAQPVSGTPWSDGTGAGGAGRFGVNGENSENSTLDPTPSQTTAITTIPTEPGETSTPVPTTEQILPPVQQPDPPGAMKQLSFLTTGILLIGLVLGFAVVGVDIRDADSATDSRRQRMVHVVLFWILAGLIAGGLYAASLPDQGWGVLLPSLGVFLVGTSTGLGYGFLKGYRFRRTLWCQGAVSAILAILLPLYSYSVTQRGEIPLFIAAIFAISALAAFRQIRRPSLPETGSEPEGKATLVGTRGADPLEIAAALGDTYADLTPIASGGLAQVYRGIRRRDGAVVAIKVPLHMDATTGACFMREMLVWKDLEHSNIVHIEGANILPFPAVEMEYIGQSLADTKKPLNVAGALPLIRGIAEGLAYAHGRGVIHRDIKPANILLTGDGIPKITDWGMSRIVTARHLPTIVGFSPSYAAPEQIAPSQFGETDNRTDIFQLGVVFYEMVTGRLPFPGEGILDTTQAILSHDPIRPIELNPETRLVEPIILHCLEKDKNKRYQNVEELIKDLDRVLRQEEGVSLP